ncbi:MAG: MFS transporter [Bacteroidales bacterium]|nr:MFS transporter [Bacteroidales bacterium]
MMLIKKFPKTFWIANAMELFERWAWYGFFMVLALYLTNSKDTGALGFSQEQKGYLMGTVVGLLYFLPVITGAIADKYGYKKVLIISYAILSTGYLMMGYFTDYALIWIVFLYIAIGAALFKPVISATIAKTTNNETSSIGFGIFYMIVNIGAFIGPVFAAKLRVISWDYVFIMAALIIGINFILLLFFYKEPQTEKKKEPLGKSVIIIFKNIWSALKDIKLLIFLIIIIGFWTMYNQLFYTLPVFIDQWVDTSVIYNALANISPKLAAAIGTEQGTIAPEMLTNIDALYIVIFQVLISTMIMKFKPLNAMMSGILISSIGIGLWFITQNGFYLFLSLLVFAIGEMASSPKILEYIGKIAPKDKVALYMGCYFLPMSAGNFFAGILSGNVYGALSDKITLLKTEIAKRGLSIPEISDNFTQNDYIDRACLLIGIDKNQLTQMLWDTYNPSKIWIVFSCIGLISVIALYFYNRFLLEKNNIS